LTQEIDEKDSDAEDKKEDAKEDKNEPNTSSENEIAPPAPEKPKRVITF
jgi:hypothetical protein